MADIYFIREKSNRYFPIIFDVFFHIYFDFFFVFFLTKFYVSVL